MAEFDPLRLRSIRVKPSLGNRLGYLREIDTPKVHGHTERDLLTVLGEAPRLGLPIRIRTNVCDIRIGADRLALLGNLPIDVGQQFHGVVGQDAAT